MGERHKLLLVQRQQRSPIPLRIQPAPLGQKLFEIEFAQQLENPFIRNLACARGRFENLPKCAWRQVRSLRQEQYVVRTRADDATGAGASETGRCSE